MKKVFVSIPLKGRSKEQIQDSLDKIKAAVEGLLDAKVEVLHQKVEDLPDFTKEDSDDSIEFIGEDLKLMSEADYFATVEHNYDYRHCSLEEDIFRRYKDDEFGKNDKMLRFSLNIIAPDVIKKEREQAEKLWKMEFKDSGCEVKEDISEMNSRD